MESFLQTEGDNCEVKMCKVSVIVPVYNAENFLQNTLNNIQRQSLKDIEIICVDDGSEDSSADIIKSFKGKIFEFVTNTKKSRSWCRA